MFIRRDLVVLIVVASFFVASLFEVPALAQSQATGTVRGVVTLEDTGKPIHGVAVTILQLRRTIMTGDDGAYESKTCPPASTTSPPIWTAFLTPSGWSKSRPGARPNSRFRSGCGRRKSRWW